MNFSPQGIDKLKRWCRTLNYPLVAIGGINLENIHSVLETKVQGMALISTITYAHDPLAVTKNLLAMVNSLWN
jgi:hydroxymethylpyrimidine kinase/phosphomethylpyrimidine kinase/thiamine-phosphate diphosphorylase